MVSIIEAILGASRRALLSALGSSLDRMPPTPPPDGVVRSWPRPAAVVNAEIRALWPGDVRVPVDEARYLELLVEWAAAVRGEASRGDVRPAA
jgi:hypothetical protein